MITIYTDGACSGNPGIGGWGAVILENNKEDIFLNGGNTSPKKIGKPIKQESV